MSQMKNDARQPMLGRSLAVVRTLLPSGEGLPLLVDRDTWLPASLSMRWVVYQRRYECAESTLRGNLSDLRHLYAWGNARFPEGLEARLEWGPGLTHDDLFHLRGWLLELPVVGARRTRAKGGDSIPSPLPAGARALVAQLFLRWAVNPASRNQRGAAPDDAAARVAQISAVLGPLAAQAGVGIPGEPIDEEVALRIDLLLAPVADASGRFLVPLQWRTDHPFRRRTRLRNWLMWCFARDCGLRLGELLTLRLGDVLDIRGQPCVRVVRRPDAPEDTRARRPQAKTLERVLPLGAHAVFAHQAYLKAKPADGGRRLGTPYLFTSLAGKPLSVNAAAKVMEQLREAIVGDFSWHAIRHAWADDVARGVLRDAAPGTGRPMDPEMAKALLIEKLRILGGWSEQSTMPMHYARRALKEYADAKLRARQNARVERILHYQRAAEVKEMP